MTTCELCGKNYEDILQHLAITHDIHDIDDYTHEVARAKEEKSKQTTFNTYVKELKEHKAKGAISATEYRELIVKWAKENPQGS